MINRIVRSRGFLPITFLLMSSWTWPAIAAQTKYPLTLQNCGRTLTFQHSPSRTVTVGQNSTEILYMLGVGNRVVGTSLWFSPVLKQYEDVNAKIERLADNDPSFERILSKKPDMVAVQFQWQIGPQGKVAKPEQFEELGIPVYTSPADCIGKDNSGSGDGVRRQSFNMDLVYQEIHDLAQIYNVQDKGDALVANTRQREADARARAASAKAQLSALFWFSSPQQKSDPFVAGRNGVPGYIMSTLGIRNIIKINDEWPTIGWETIAKSNPTFIVAADMERRRYPLDSLEAKMSFLKKDPVTKLMPAVEKKYVFPMDAQAMNPGIRTIDGIETLANEIVKEGLVR